MAGESAQEVARKRRDKAARLTQVAEAYEKGAEGERRTAHALAMLPASGWFVLHDVRWPGRRFANIDHVVVGPGGVFVIDSKAWSGVVEVRDGVLRQNGYQRDEAVASAADAAAAVAEQVPGLSPTAVTPVLCFAGERGVEGYTRGVILCTPGSLVGMLMSRPQVLDARAVRRTLLGLQQALAAATSAAPRPDAAPTPSARRTAAAPRSPRASQSRKSGRGGSAYAVLGLVVMVGLVLFGAKLLPKAADAVSHAVASGLTPTPPAVPSSHPLGTRRRIPPGAHRPPLRVTADHPITAHRVGSLPYLYDGNRFFAVRVQIRNVGRRPWMSQPGTAFRVIDAEDIPHESESAMRIREGRVLPETIRLAPGHMTRGFVVFQDRATVPITGVTLSVGPGEPREVTWSIARQ